jgi:hypothetical protein
MTPPAAATVAARRRATSARSASAGRAGGARPPRRVSGPARPAARAAAAAAVALPQPRTRPSPPPRRRPVAVPRPARRAADQTLGARALEWLRALPDHRLLDRLIGGRVWIVLLGTLLVGIVTMQLSLLRMNASIGRAVERTSTLEQRNAALRLSISQLSDSELIAGLATQMGFVMPLQGSPRFLSASAADPAKALTTMRVPDPTATFAAAEQLAATTDASATTTTTVTDPAATPTDPAATDPAATDPAGTTPSTTAPATTVPPATSTTTPTTAPTAGGASAPVQPQG